MVEVVLRIQSRIAGVAQETPEMSLVSMTMLEVGERA